MNLVYLYYALFSFLPGLFFSSWITSLDRMGLGLSGAALSYAYFMVGQASLELPTGYLADSWGRKRTTILGLLIYVSAFSAVYFTADKGIIYALLVVAGIGQTLMSGAQSAWFIDVFERRAKASGLAPDSRGFFLRLDLIRRTNLGLGALLGATLLARDPKYLWLALGIVGAVALGVALSIDSDNAVSERREKTGGIDFAGVMTNLKDPMLVGMLMMGLFYGIEVGNRDTIMQPFIVSELGHGDSYGMILIQSGVAIFGILGNRLYARLRRRKGAQTDAVGRRDISLMLIPLVVMGAAQAFAPKVHSVTAFAGLYFAGIFTIGWFYPLQSFVLNALIGRRHRAFLLSAENMLECLTQALVCVFVSNQLGSARAGQFWYLGSGAVAAAGVAIIVGYCVRSKMNVGCDPARRCDTPVPPARSTELEPLPPPDSRYGFLPQGLVRDE